MVLSNMVFMMKGTTNGRKMPLLKKLGDNLMDKSQKHLPDFGFKTE